MGRVSRRVVAVALFASAAGPRPCLADRRKVAEYLTTEHGFDQPSIRWLTKGPPDGSPPVYYFNFDDDVHGHELWRTTLEPGSTQLLRDIKPGPDDSYPSNFAVLGASVYFAADDGIAGNELFVSDGTPEGTVRLMDIMTGPDGSHPQSLTECASKLYFVARDKAHGFELWVSDGTPQGTNMVDDLSDGDSSISLLRCEGDALHFTLGRADDTAPKQYVTHGTKESTHTHSKDEL